MVIKCNMMDKTMPTYEEHCQHSLARYGVRGDDIHRYLDEPSRRFGQSHRQFRHDTETIKLVGKLFGSKYGKEMAENIALDHITADHEEERKRDGFVLLKCPNCGGQLSDLEAGKGTCKYCGYETEVFANRESSIKLPKRGWIVLYRKTTSKYNASLPRVLPPLEVHWRPFVVDPLYSQFTNREELQVLL
ncbi:hypothetical protein MUP77_11560, partial [Candidatus Bathyarchaeota archaeon]|nr:hypothetical protein [Candidatus Bathyarchaeota archaeon]